MTAPQLFSIANTTALLGWLLLIFAPRRRWSMFIVRAIPLILAALYVFLLATHWGESKGDFNTLAGVASLFSSPWILLGGWVHYLAFDLFIGHWELRDAEQHGIHHLLVIPCLLLTFLFGPAGLLLYHALKAVSKARTAQST